MNTTKFACRWLGIAVVLSMVATIFTPTAYMQEVQGQKQNLNDASIVQPVVANTAGRSDQGWSVVRDQWKFKIDVPQRITKDPKLTFIVNNGRREIGRVEFSEQSLQHSNFKNLPQEIKDMIQNNAYYKEAVAKQAQIKTALEAIAKVNGTVTPQGSSGQWQTLQPKSWRFRVDGPHNDGGRQDTQKVHVHVEYQGKEVAAEGVDGSVSHGYTMDKGQNGQRVPKHVQDQIKNHPEYKKGKKKQENIDKAAKEIKSKNLTLDWWHVWDVVIAIGIVVLATGTFFFPGDDIAAWINFFRVLKLT